MWGGIGFSRKAVPEDYWKWTGHVAGPRVFHGMAMLAVRGGADADPTWGCVRRAWGAHEAVWLCSGGEAQYRSQVLTSIRNSNKIAKIPGKFVSPHIESWESHQWLAKQHTFFRVDQWKMLTLHPAPLFSSIGLKLNLLLDESCGNGLMECHCKS
jgi:hypothetical protein